MVRIPENNDWVIFAVVLCAFAYVFMLLNLHRGIPIWKYFQQKFTESANHFLSWLLVTVVFCVSLSVLMSQYVPIIPRIVKENFTFGDIGFTKFGFVLTSLLVFYAIKNIISYVFFASIGKQKAWQKFYFEAHKFYFAASVILLLACIMHYYFPIDKKIIFQYYIIAFFAGFLFKIFYYLFHNQQILPFQWYYKFLYICTLQILPVLVIWKFIFL